MKLTSSLVLTFSTLATLSTALGAQAPEGYEGYKTTVNCVSQSETAKITAEFKTLLAGGLKRPSLTLAKINGVEFKLEEVPTAGPLVLAVKSVTNNVEMTLLNKVLNKASEEITTSAAAGLEVVAIKCAIEVSSEIQ